MRRAFADLHFTLDHGDSRALESAVDREDGSLDRHPAVIGVDVETAAVLVGGVDDDVPPREVDGRAAARGAELELGAFVHLNDSAVCKPEERARVLGGSNDLA